MEGIILLSLQKNQWKESHQTGFCVIVIALERLLRYVFLPLSHAGISSTGAGRKQQRQPFSWHPLPGPARGPLQGPQRSQLCGPLALACEDERELCVSGSCLSGYPVSQKRLGRNESEHIHMQGQGIQDYFGPNNTSGGGGLHREEPGLGIFGPPRP